MYGWLSKDKQNILNQGYRIIDSNYEYWYLDCGAGNWLTGNTSWCDPFKAWQDMYLYDPAEGLNDAEARLVIGGEAAMWGEQLDVNTLDQKIWPRLSTVAERLWGLPEEETMKIKDKRVRTQAALYRLRYHYLFLLKKGIKASGLQPKFCHVSPYCDDYTL